MIGEKKRLAILASGKGSNALNIIGYFKKHPSIEIAFILSNNPEADILKSCDESGVETFVFHSKHFYETDQVLEFLKEEKIDCLILAGFLWLIPENILHAFHDRIINIHPALLPDFGGKGMYGKNVHAAVLQSGAKQSGITVHLVNEKYDAGKIIFQKTCVIDDNETTESLSHKIKTLEHENYPGVIEKYISEKEAT